jgi:hypothetical protein
VTDQRRRGDTISADLDTPDVRALLADRRRSALRATGARVHAHRCGRRWVELTIDRARCEVWPEHELLAQLGMSLAWLRLCDTLAREGASSCGFKGDCTWLSAPNDAAQVMLAVRVAAERGDTARSSDPGPIIVGSSRDQARSGRALYRTRSTGRLSRRR